MAARRSRLSVLAQPTRPVPFAMQLQFPHLRTRVSHQHESTPELPPTTTDNVAASESGSPSKDDAVMIEVTPLRQSISLPALPRGRATRPSSDYWIESSPKPHEQQASRRHNNDGRGESEYRRPCGIIYGGLEYRRRRVEVKARYLDHVGRFDPREERRQRKLRQKREALKKEMQKNARQFDVADANADGVLDFNEFCDLMYMQLQPRRSRHRPAAPAAAAGASTGSSPVVTGKSSKGAAGAAVTLPDRTMLKDWFHLIDVNASGSISLTEFFAFSLREALARANADSSQSLLAFMKVWDRNGDGVLDPDEFMRVAFALGFAQISRELWDACDANRDGIVTFGEINREMRVRMKDGDTSGFLRRATQAAQKAVRATQESLWRKAGQQVLQKTGSKLKLDALARDRSLPTLDPQTHLAMVTAFSRIDLKGRRSGLYDPTDKATRRKENAHVDAPLALLRSWMRSSGYNALDVFQSWDSDASYLLTRFELGKGLKQLGLTLSIELLTLVFDRLAVGYHLTYDEFRKWFDDTSSDVDTGGGGGGKRRAHLGRGKRSAGGGMLDRKDHRHDDDDDEDEGEDGEEEEEEGEKEQGVEELKSLLLEEAHEAARRIQGLMRAFLARCRAKRAQAGLDTLMGNARSLAAEAKAGRARATAKKLFRSEERQERANELALTMLRKTVRQSKGGSSSTSPKRTGKHKLLQGRR